MNLFLNQKETHRHRKQTYDCTKREKVVGGGINYNVQINLYTTYKIGNQQAQGSNKQIF